mmetsp:Transcript_17079/g.25261  ORF Transcript_17079/g.25261 Transcript_17079/m.25261 type:complete len:103 (+) Transcript_17079:52-360(+)
MNHISLNFEQLNDNCELKVSVPRPRRVIDTIIIEELNYTDDSLRYFRKNDNLADFVEQTRGSLVSWSPVEASPFLTSYELSCIRNDERADLRISPLELGISA